MNENKPAFGDPDFCYGSSAELIAAVTSFPTRFSPETHSLVSELIQDEVKVTELAIVPSE